MKLGLHHEREWGDRRVHATGTIISATELAPCHATKRKAAKVDITCNPAGLG